MSEVPVAKLSIEVQATNPPKPHGVGVMVDGRVVAVVTLEEFQTAFERYERLRDAHDGRHRSMER